MSADNIVILVRTRADDPTGFSHEWAENLRSRFVAQDWSVLDCDGDGAVRENVERALHQQPGSLLVFYGHGLPDRLMGQNGKPVCDAANSDLLQNRAIYSVSCFSGQNFGPGAVSQGARCFLGYEEAFSLLFDHARYFGLCANAGMTAWLEAETDAEQALAAAIATYDHWIDYFHTGAGREDPDSIDIAIELVGNREALRLLGDPRTCLVAMQA